MIGDIIPDAPEIVGGLFVKTNELRWLGDARIGTDRSMLPRGAHDTAAEQLMTGITVVDVGQRRFMLCTDSHRLHALVLERRGGRAVPGPGHYQHAGGRRFVRVEQLFVDRFGPMLAGLDDHRPISLRLSRWQRSNRMALPVITDPGAVIVFRRQGAEIVSPTGRHIADLDGQPLVDRRRSVTELAVRLSVLHSALDAGIDTLTTTGPVAPLYGHTGRKAVVLMSCAVPSAPAAAEPAA